MTAVSASHSWGNSAATCATGQWCWQSCPPPEIADAVRAVAERQLAGLEARASSAVEGAVRAAQGEPVDRAQALAAALTAEGYAATASAISGGGQLCQHHCPVAHVAAEFPQLCEAETAAISRVLGRHVQRLATIAHGDGVCTTCIPAPRTTDEKREKVTT